MTTTILLWILYSFLAVCAVAALLLLGWLLFTPVPLPEPPPPIPADAIPLASPTDGFVYAYVWRNDANTRTCLRFRNCPRHTIMWDARLDSALCDAVKQLSDKGNAHANETV